MNQKLFAEHYKDFQTLENDELLEIFENSKTNSDEPQELFEAIKTILRERSQDVPLELVRITNEIEETNLTSSDRRNFVYITSYLIVIIFMALLVNKIFS